MAKRSWVNFAALWAWLKDGNKIINRKCAVHAAVFKWQETIV